MVVGEPSLMGGEFGEEDERLISRLENAQYDPAAQAAQVAAQGPPGPPGPGGPSLMDPDAAGPGGTFGGPPPGGPGSGPGGWPPPTGPPPPPPPPVQNSAVPKIEPPELKKSPKN